MVCHWYVLPESNGRRHTPRILRTLLTGCSKPCPTLNGGPGTSSGFGRELVHAALERGDCVVATARRLDSIQDLPQTDRIRLMEVDVTEGFASLKTKLDIAASFFGRIDVVVNNAGHGFTNILEEGGCVGYFPSRNHETRLTASWFSAIL